MCPIHFMPTWLTEVGSLRPETLQNAAQGSCALHPPGLLWQVQLPFQFDAIFLRLCRRSQAELLLLACYCMLLIHTQKEKVILSSTPLPCHLRHMLMKDRFWHLLSSETLRPPHRFIINEDTTVILLLFIFITTPKPSCRYLCASQIPNHIPRSAQHFMLELALMWHYYIDNVLNKDVFTHILLLTFPEFTYFRSCRS